MNPAAATVAALILAILLSMVSRINVGIVAIALAWIVGVYGAGLTPDTIVRGFPASLFLTLAGVTLLFACAEANGTLEALAQRAIRLARGSARALPVVFFLIACLISTVGPGAIASVALVVPLAMRIGERAGVSHFLTALMVANGANAGNLSPISSVGVIANSRMAEAGLPGHEGKVWLANFAAHALVALGAWLALTPRRTAGGAVAESERARAPAPALSAAAASPGAADTRADAGSDRVAPPEAVEPSLPLTRRQIFTVATVLAWIAGVLVLGLNLGLAAFAAVSLLVACRAVTDAAAVRRMPWGAILMVCGVSVLVALLEASGGMELFTALLARLATPATVNGVIAFVTGIISSYSSTSGVVLPAFLPTVPGVVEQLGGGNPLAVALSINVGSALVDVSPLSTLGALCVAAVADGAAATLLFRRLLAWGLSMAVVGALICQLFLGWLARA